MSSAAWNGGLNVKSEKIKKTGADPILMEIESTPFESIVRRGAF